MAGTPLCPCVCVWWHRVRCECGVLVRCLYSGLVVGPPQPLRGRGESEKNSEGPLTESCHGQGQSCIDLCSLSVTVNRSVTLSKHNLAPHNSFSLLGSDNHLYSSLLQSSQQMRVATKERMAAHIFRARRYSQNSCITQSCIQIAHRIVHTYSEKLVIQAQVHPLWNLPVMLLL